MTTIRAEQDLEAGKELPITIEKNVANSQGKMVPTKVGVCIIGLGANFRAGSGRNDDKLEGESVNKVLLFSHFHPSGSCPQDICPYLCIYVSHRETDSHADRRAINLRHMQEPMEVLVGFSNTPIDPQTCMMLGLPLGSSVCENVCFFCEACEKCVPRLSVSVPVSLSVSV